MGTTGTPVTTATNNAAETVQQPIGTKLSELIDEMGGRLPNDKIPNLIPVVNRAVAILAKRLYIHKSDLIKDDLAIAIAAEVTYTASTISFVSGGDASADSIVDTAGQFVVEGFVAGMAIFSDCAGNTGNFKIDSVTSNVITLILTDKVTVTAAGSAVTLTSRANFGYLPDDFFGFLSEPNIDGYTNTLPQIPNRAEELTWALAGAGLPQYHKLMGDKLYVYPATSSDITIGGEYFKKVTKLTSMDDYVPFAGLFDDVIQDYIIAILGGGPAATVGLAGMLGTAVDLIVAKREIKTIQKMPGGIDYNNLMES
jgi:hypothetical protein